MPKLDDVTEIPVACRWYNILLLRFSNSLQSIINEYIKDKSHVLEKNFVLSWRPDDDDDDDDDDDGELFCGMVDLKKVCSLIPHQISSKRWAGFELSEFRLVEWSCAVVITITPLCH